MFHVSVWKCFFCFFDLCVSFAYLLYILGVCRIVIFAKSEYSAEYTLPNNKENMFKNKKRQKKTNYDYIKVIKQFCTSSFYYFIVYLFYTNFLY